MSDQDYGCWKCGSHESRIRRTDKDEDGHPIRIRVCAKCGGQWFTEEVRLAQDVRWFQRAASAVRRQRQRQVGRFRTCRFCGVRWRLGGWMHHVTKNTDHLAWKARRKEERLIANREDQRYRRANPAFRAIEAEYKRRRRIA